MLLADGSELKAYTYGKHIMAKTIKLILIRITTKLISFLNPLSSLLLALFVAYTGQFERHDPFLNH